MLEDISETKFGLEDFTVPEHDRDGEKQEKSFEAHDEGERQTPPDPTQWQGFDQFDEGGSDDDYNDNSKEDDASLERKLSIMIRDGHFRVRVRSKPDPDPDPDPKFKGSLNFDPDPDLRV